MPCTCLRVNSGAMDETHRGVTGQRRYRGWLLGTWIAVLLCAVVELVVGFVVAGLVAFLYGGVCFEPASVEGMRDGRHTLLVISALAVAPWLAALAWTRYRLRLALLGLLAAGPVLLVTADALLSSAADWSSGWCMY